MPPKAKNDSSMSTAKAKKSVPVLNLDDTDSDEEQQQHLRKKKLQTKKRPHADKEDENDENKEGPPTKQARKGKTKAEFYAFYAGKTPEEIFDLVKAGWTSEVYSYFNVALINKNTSPTYQFSCKLNSSSRPVTRAPHDTSTSNLHRHRKECVACSGKGSEDSQLTVAQYARGSTYSLPALRLLQVEWVAECHRPFSIVEDEPYRKICRMLHGGVKFVSRQTLSKDVNDVFKLSREELRKLLQGITSRLHIALDGWTSPNVISTLGIVIIFFDDKLNKIRVITLDLLELTAAHTGEYLANRIFECLQDLGIAKQLLAQVMDNASNNDTLVSHLQTLLPPTTIAGIRTQVRCFAHILNLVVKAILSQFDRVKNNATEDEIEAALSAYDDDDESDAGAGDADALNEFEVDEEREAHDQQEIEDLSAVLDEVRNLDARNAQEGCLTITKVKKLSKRMANSPSIQQSLKEACMEEAMKPKEMLSFVPTRWNTLSSTINRCMEIRRPIDKVVILPKYNEKTKTPLKRLKLSFGEWNLLEQLQPILQWFADATELISASAVPLVHTVIPMIDILTDKLEEALQDDSLHAAVRAAVARGLAVLNKYYAKTDDGIMHRLCMILHPKFKKQYMLKRKWPSAWIDAAVELAVDIWETHYKPTISTAKPKASKRTKNSIFADDDDNAVDIDVLQVYLSAPPDPSCRDPVAFWASRLDKSDTITPDGALARFAIDFLSSPAASTDAEQLFSHGGLNVSKHRHSLGYESLRAQTVLNSWFRAGLVPESACVEFFRQMASRRCNTVDESNRESDTDVVD